MTEAEARLLLRDCDEYGGMEAWVAARRWKAMPGGWIVNSELQGRQFRVEVIASAMPRHERDVLASDARHIRYASATHPLHKTRHSLRAMSSDRPSDASHRGVLAQRQDHPVLCRDNDGHQRDYLLRHEPFSRPTAGAIATFTAEDLALGTASKQQDRDQGTPAILTTVDRVTWLEQRRPDPDVILLRD